MTETLLLVWAALLVSLLSLAVAMVRRSANVDLADILPALAGLEKAMERTDRTVRGEIATNREEALLAARASREELGHALQTLRAELMGQLDLARQDFASSAKALREETCTSIARIQTDSLTNSKALREELGTTLKAFNDSLLKGLSTMSDAQQKQMDSSWTRLDTLRLTVEEKLKSLQEDNAKKLEQMRQTVDEKLQGTLEKRLGESFQQVSERLEQVYKGLGEMQTLASGVGDLKKVLTNVKARGTWGEVQLGALLEQVLTADQYAADVATTGGGERVEYAIRLPGRADDRDEPVWLPIDAKFPLEDYQRLLDAQDRADPEAALVAERELEIRVKGCARDISSKYLSPPKTTDFAILFLPVEGLFAEVVRRPALTDWIQRECRVIVAGPSTLWSLLSSLQMGFRTLAIQRRSSEVWSLLSAVKTEWSKYGDVLARVQKKLQEASHSIDDAARRTRVIGRKLKEVQALPTATASQLLVFDGGDDVSCEDALEPVA